MRVNAHPQMLYFATVLALAVSLTAIAAYAFASPGLWLLRRHAALPAHGMWMPLAVVVLWWALYVTPQWLGFTATQFWNVVELPLVVLALAVFVIVFAVFGGSRPTRPLIRRVLYWLLPLLAVMCLRLLMPPIYE